MAPWRPRGFSGGKLEQGRKFEERRSSIWEDQNSDTQPKMAPCFQNFSRHCKLTLKVDTLWRRSSVILRSFLCCFESYHMWRSA